MTKPIREPSIKLNINDLYYKNQLHNEQLDKIVEEILLYNAGRLKRRDAFNFIRFFKELKCASKKELDDLTRLRYGI